MVEDFEEKRSKMLKKVSARTLEEFCINCYNTEEVACDFCNYEGKGEPSEYQTFQDSLNYLTINWENK